MLIDARAQACPKPMMMAEEALSGIGEGVVEVLVDNETAVMNLTWFANKNSFHVESEKEGKDWRVRIAKGVACEPVADTVAQGEENDLLLVVGTDTMGKEEDLGKILMKAFFETIKVTKELPHTIFFLNAGVKLTTTNEELAPILKGLEELGVEVYSCGTCLDYYGLQDSLKVGHRGSSDIIVGGMKDFTRTVWI